MDSYWMGNIIFGACWKYIAFENEDIKIMAQFLLLFAVTASLLVVWSSNKGIVTNLHMWDKQGIYQQIFIRKWLHVTLCIVNPKICKHC